MNRCIHMCADKCKITWIQDHNIKIEHMYMDTKKNSTRVQQCNSTRRKEEKSTREEHKRAK